MDDTSDRKPPHQVDKGVLDLHDDFAHGRLTRRDNVKPWAAFAVGGITVETLEQNLAPDDGWAQQVPANDARSKKEPTTGFTTTRHRTTMKPMQNSRGKKS